MTGDFSRSSANRRTPDNESAVMELNVRVEFIRLIAYINLMIVFLCAGVFSKTLVKARLAAGGKDGDVCGAFNGVLGNNIDPPILPGEGFDLETQSHLVRSFGYNNICSTWDYSPSREYTGLIYPLYEYALLLYLVLDFIQTSIYFKKGWVSESYYRAAKFLFIPMIIGCAWFRMIFVVAVYESVGGHTAGFFCMQVTFLLVALMNTWFIVDSKAEYSFLGGRKGTMIVAGTFITGILLVSPLKLYLTGYLVLNGVPSPISAKLIGGYTLGTLNDTVWTVLNSVCPMLLGFIRGFCEPELNIVFNVPPSKWTDENEVEVKSKVVTENTPML
jgi:hypothetical protein